MTWAGIAPAVGTSCEGNRYARATYGAIGGNHAPRAIFLIRAQLVWTEAAPERAVGAN